MEVAKRPNRVYTLDEARELLKQPASEEELLQRQAALKDSDRFLRETDPILGEDVKDWIRRERAELPRRGGQSTASSPPDLTH